MLECVSFSSDGSQIAVSRLDGRDARTPLKLYKADVSRVVSLLDVTNGECLRIIHQDFQTGNCGPAFHLWRVGRTSAVVNPGTDRVLVHAFGGGDLTQYAVRETSVPVVTALPNQARNVAVSRTGRFVAASGDYLVSILDSQASQVVKRIEAEDTPFLGASLLAFSHDETRLVVATSQGIHVWNTQGDAPPSTVIEGVEPWTNAISVAPDDTVLVCAEEGTRRYDFDGNLVSTYLDGECYAGHVSPDGRTAAVVRNEIVVILDLDTGSVIKRLNLGWAPSLAFSPDSKSLVVGLPHGKVAMIDANSGKRIWSATPPGHYRWPWTLPALLLIVWCFVAWSLVQSSGATTAARSRLADPD
jgi:WD40 repeat protein